MWHQLLSFTLFLTLFHTVSAINRPDITDTEMETIMDTIVDSLFCFFVTLGAIPIIRCSRGTAAEMVAVKLDKKLRENLRDARNSLFTGDTLGAGQFSFQRPLLVLVDRNIDLATPLHHTWTYQALVHDVLMCMQRSTFRTKIPFGSGYRKVGGTDRRLFKDRMWRSNEEDWNQ